MYYQYHRICAKIGWVASWIKGQWEQIVPIFVIDRKTIKIVESTKDNLILWALHLVSLVLPSSLSWSYNQRNESNFSCIIFLASLLEFLHLSDSHSTDIFSPCYSSSHLVCWINKVVINEFNYTKKENSFCFLTCSIKTY